MIRTPVCDLLRIDHPIALGGMGSVYAPGLVAAVSSAGGLGAMGCHYLRPEQTAAIREHTSRPFALNFLLFDVEEDAFSAALELQPSVIAFAWPRAEQEPLGRVALHYRLSNLHRVVTDPGHPAAPADVLRFAVFEDPQARHPRERLDGCVVVRDHAGRMEGANDIVTSPGRCHLSLPF